MISHELARQLKDAGFPQHIEGSLNPIAEPAYEPTLSELIAACGSDSPLNLHFYPLKGFEKWEASNVALSMEALRQGAEGKGGWGLIANGATPEEAVARLWLALNKK